MMAVAEPLMTVAASHGHHDKPFHLTDNQYQMAYPIATTILHGEQAKCFHCWWNSNRGSYKNDAGCYSGIIRITKEE
jgi:hypothetical protein